MGRGKGEVVACSGWIERDMAVGISKACWAWPNGRETWASNELTGKQTRNRNKKQNQQTETDTKFCFMATLTELTWSKARVAVRQSGRETERERVRRGGVREGERAR